MRNQGAAKRRKEMERAEKQRDKAERRKERKKDKADGTGALPGTPGEDPDLAGIVPGPQPRGGP